MRITGCCTTALGLGFALMATTVLTAVIGIALIILGGFIWQPE